MVMSLSDERLLPLLLHSAGVLVFLKRSDIQALTTPLSRVSLVLLAWQPGFGLVSFPFSLCFDSAKLLLVSRKDEALLLPGTCTLSSAGSGSVLSALHWPLVPCLLTTIFYGTPLTSRPSSVCTVHSIQCTMYNVPKLCTFCSCAFLWVPLIVHPLTCPSTLHVCIGCPALPGR